MTSDSWPRTLVGTLVRTILPIGILIAGGYGYQRLSIEPEQEAVPPAAPQLLRTQVTTLKVCDYPLTVKTQGILQAHNQVTLSAQVAGEVQRISPRFEVGSYFEEGEVLLEIDAGDYMIAVAAAEAKCAGAKANLTLAIKNLERHESLAEQNAISRAELDQMSASRDLMVAELESAQSALEQAKRDLDRTKVIAPFDGRVQQKLVGLGQTISSGTSLGVLFATDFAEVRLPIAAKDMKFLELPELERDKPLEVELRDSLDEASSAVRVAQIIRTEGALDTNSLDLFVIARIEDPFGLKSGLPPMRIGQPVVASIRGKVLPKVFAIPRGAVRQLDQITLVEPSLTLKSKRIVPLWSDQEHVIVRDETIEDGAMLSTTQLVYAPDGAPVEIIPTITSETSIANQESVLGKPTTQVSEAESISSDEEQEDDSSSSETPSVENKQESGKLKSAFLPSLETFAPSVSQRSSALIANHHSLELE